MSSGATSELLGYVPMEVGMLKHIRLLAIACLRYIRRLSKFQESFPARGFKIVPCLAHTDI